MQKTNRIVYLLRGQIEGKLNSEEQLELDMWVIGNPSRRKLMDEVSDPESLFQELSKFDNVYGEDETASMARMSQMVNAKVAGFNNKRTVRLWKWIPYAAAVLVFAIIGVTFWKSTPVERDPKTIVLDDVGPGGQKAILTLADGRQVNLREDQGYIVLQGGDMRYPDGSSVLEDEVWPPIRDEARYMSISVPKGGTYQVVLSDGTKVWLNSSSILWYPERFVGLDRLVELEGEAYFDVSSLQREGKKSVFIVKSRHQKIEVLGTQFNVSAYNDQQEIVTTLVEGLVSVVPNDVVADRFLLEPGYQSIVLGKDKTIREVDIASYIAWKDGLFYFTNTSFDDLMRQISRWYNIEVVYRSQIPQDTFTGKMSRDLSLMTVLELLNVSNINVRIEGGKLVVN
ncbi:MAG TPA: DUF4974 domain-containing protein [Sphingobacterium sp.]|nr:DUF4974 domain-containing protein [Sphingobacterium sp.]